MTLTATCSHDRTLPGALEPTHAGGPLTRCVECRKRRQREARRRLTYAHPCRHCGVKLRIGSSWAFCSTSCQHSHKPTRMAPVDNTLRILDLARQLEHARVGARGDQGRDQEAGELTMTKRVSTGDLSGERVAKRILFLAYEPSAVVGLGILQARSRVGEDEIADHVEGGWINADYVRGRMVKLWGFRYGPDWIEFDDEATPRPDYQSWAWKYPTNEALVLAAIKSLEQPK